jgi:long-subunit fatty acid transport protein
MHTELGFNAEDMLPDNPELNANTLGGGIAYAYNQKFHINLGLGYTWYEDDDFVSDTTGAKIKYDKDITFLAFGLEYRFM